MGQIQLLPLTVLALLCFVHYCSAIDCDDIECAENVQCWEELESESDSVCICAYGFIENASTTSCEDINECEHPSMNYCLFGIHTCVNTYGGYYCQCKEGFELECSPSDLNNRSMCPVCNTEAYCDSSTEFVCECKFSSASDGEQCPECPVGTFTPLNHPCEPCPANSEAPEPGLLKCSCLEGYYKTPREDRRTACTQSPSAPLNVSVSYVTNTSVILSWLPPENDGGRDPSEIHYDISISGEGVILLSTYDTVAILTGLTPFSNYIFSITSGNDISFLDRNVLSRTAFIAVTTLERVISVKETPTLPNNTGTTNSTDGQTVQEATTPPNDGGITNSTDGQTTNPGYNNNILYALLPSLAIVFVTVGILCFLYYMKYRKRKMKKRKANNTSGTFINQQSELPMHPNHYVVKDRADTCTLSKVGKELENISQHIPREVLLSKENIQLSDVIGQGEFGQVYKGYMKTRIKADVVAVKTLKALNSEIDVKLLMKEIAKMVHFDHPNVMTLTGVILTDGGAPLLVMPYMAKGTLLMYVRDNKTQFLIEEEEPDKVKVASKTLCELSRQIALGMEYLAKNKVIHRDLAARNCLLDMSCTLKVADFGLSEDVYSTNYYRHSNSVGDVEYKVPIRWMPLESIEEGLYTEKSDVWSFGVTVWEIFTCGKVPYNGISCMALTGVLRRGEHLERPHNKACSAEVFSLLEDCWNVDPQGRPKFTNIVQRIDGMMEEKFGYMRMDSSLSLKAVPKNK